MTIDVVLAPSDQAGLTALLASLYDPASPRYHQWLSSAEFAARFGPASATVAGATRWLATRGLSAHRVSDFALSVSAPASRLSAALGTSFERYRAPTGATGYLASSAPEVPADLIGSIHAVLGLDTLPVYADQLSSAPPQRRLPGPVGAPTGTGGSQVHAQSTVGAAGLPSACPAAAATALAYGSYTMDQLGRAYGLRSLFGEGLNGRGETIAVYELAAHSQNDVADYESCFGLTNQVSAVPVDGGGPTGTGGTDEANLDIEQAATQAPGASILSYEGPNSFSGRYDVWSRIVSDDRAQVVSTSWGFCEPDAAQSGDLLAMSTIFEQAAAQGQTILAASGDSGSEGCFQDGSGDTSLQADYPASDPLVTAVGGTTLYAPGDETAWNDCQANETLVCADNSGGQAAGGGGLSRYEARPSYQPAVLSWPSPQSCGTACRQLPDISVNAGAGMVIYSSGRWEAGGGTSFSAPFMAGLVADRNQGCVSKTGELNPTLYSLASNVPHAYGTALSDVTSGDNDMTGSNSGQYPARAGFDGATGLGSPLAGGLTCPEVDSVSPANATPGSTVTVSGSGLEGATISFGDVTASVTASTATSATVTVPAGTGSATVSAAGVLGHGTLTAAFTFGGGSSTGGGSSATTTSGTPPAGGASSPTTTGVCPTRAGAALPSASGIAASQVGGCSGYLVVDSAGQVSAFGSAVWRGDLSGSHLAAPIIAIQATPDGGGYWLLGSDGGIFSFGDAGYYGSTGAIKLAAPVVGMAATPDGRGYWIVARDGGVFSFGDATFHGSTGGIRLAQPVDGIAVAPGGSGYWLVAADGGVFAFTSDGFFGSLGSVHLAEPIVGMSGTVDGRGYTLVGSDGGVFSFGDAPFYGSLGSNPPASPIVDLSPVPGGGGYYLITGAGGVYAFGPGARNLGSV